MKLLLHTCCAPCAIYPVSEAKECRIDITGYFYNPNIHPESEYEKRKKEAEKYFRSKELDFISGEYDMESYFDCISNHETQPARCWFCWHMRLKETVNFAKKHAFDAFTTTLLGSPYQNHEVIKNICETLSNKYIQNFYYGDFRVGFKKAHEKAKQEGVYCQNFCGCVFSRIEREEALKR